MKKFKHIIIGALAVMGLSACGDSFLDTDLPAYLDSDKAAEAAGKRPEVFCNGIWSWYGSYQGKAHDQANMAAMMIIADVMGQDMALNKAGWFGFDYQFDFRNKDWRRSAMIWNFNYTNIAKANEILSLYPEGPKNVGQYGLIGNALAVRAYAYYQLIQFFQCTTNEDGTVNYAAKGVPIMAAETEGTPEERDALKGRNTVGDVFKVIEGDLTKAVEYFEMTDESGKVYERPNKQYVDGSVANGLLARFYLLDQKWDKALACAKKAQEGYAIMNEWDGFTKIDNEEWMWGLEIDGENTINFISFSSHMSNFGAGYAGLDAPSKLIDASLYSAIADNDNRKKFFNGPEGWPEGPANGVKRAYANKKYASDGNFTEDVLYMRASEMVLIEAECQARLGNSAEAGAALYKLTSKRIADAKNEPALLEQVLMQRRIELWGEGFEYFDHKRMNTGINRDYEGTNHPEGYRLTIDSRDKRWYLQIPNSEMQENTHLDEIEDQNP